MDDTLAADLDDALRAGVAVYNAGEHHAAHDAWEAHWLDLEQGTDDERLLHGLIQFTAAIYHARRRNWSGATGLAESALGYLDDLPADYRGLNLGTVRGFLARFHADPECIERGSLPSLRVDDDSLEPAGLGLAAAGVAARTVAEEYAYDESVVEDAVRFAREETDPGGSQYATFLRDFVADDRHRALIFQRLSDLVKRERRKEEDVAGLFGDEGGDES